VVGPVTNVAGHQLDITVDVDGLNSDAGWGISGVVQMVLLDDAGNVGIKIINSDGAVEFVVADIALSTNSGVWLAGLPETATIITVGQGFVTSGAVVEAVPEGDIETSVAIKAISRDD